MLLSPSADGFFHAVKIAHEWDLSLPIFTHSEESTIFIFVFIVFLWIQLHFPRHRLESFDSSFLMCNIGDVIQWHQTAEEILASEFLFGGVRPTWHLFRCWFSDNLARRIFGTILWYGVATETKITGKQKSVSWAFLCLCLYAKDFGTPGAYKSFPIHLCRL